MGLAFCSKTPPYPDLEAIFALNSARDWKTSSKTLNKWQDNYKLRPSKGDTVISLIISSFCPLKGCCGPNQASIQYFDLDF